MAAWEIFLTDEVEIFLDDLYEFDRQTHKLVNQAILVLEQSGPAEGRPLVDTVTASALPNLKELRPESRGRSEGPHPVRIRPVAIGDPACSRRQVRTVEPVVPRGDPASRAVVRSVRAGAKEGAGQ